ncbi:hypothetical protein RclHR1_03920011 [Rhizophagus clarus]|uniref:Uncharacterized protein n=1 Tax=Rhizophagus clarus TaxID=94130 RepID=A0A2Z6RVV8_9GLOM|nr:hypothetical protein RclHR1_03920011 [Rhizophagus clarus]GES99575.1 hypothetical protein GLOIN_2v1837144 [Rhizophagus clarus]
MSITENNRSVKDDTNSFSELIAAVRDVRDNANMFLSSLVRFDSIRHEVNIGSLNNFIQGILNTDYNEVEEVVAVDTSSISQQSNTPTTLTTTKTSPELSTTKSPLVIHNTSPYTQTTHTDIQINGNSPIVTGSLSDSSVSQVSQVLDDRSDTTTTSTTTTNSVKTTKISFNRPRGRPRKFSNKYATIIDQAVPTKSAYRSSSNVIITGSSRITGKSISSSEIYYSDTSDSLSVQSGSATIYSSDDDSHLEKVMNLVRTYISTTRSDVLKNGIYTWKNTRPIFVNEHLVKVKKLFRNNSIPTSINEDDDIVNAFKRIHTSRRSMHLTRKKYVHTNSNNIINVVNSVDKKRNRGRPPKNSSNNSSKGKQSMR